MHLFRLLKVSRRKQPMSTSFSAGGLPAMAIAGEMKRTNYVEEDHFGSKEKGRGESFLHFSVGSPSPNAVTRGPHRWGSTGSFTYSRLLPCDDGGNRKASFSLRQKSEGLLMRLTESRITFNSPASRTEATTDFHTLPITTSVPDLRFCPANTVLLGQQRVTSQRNSPVILSRTGFCGNEVTIKRRRNAYCL